MSAPQITVVFADADGDEFPYAVYGTDLTDDAATRIAFRHMTEDIGTGHVRPTGEMHRVRVERV